MKILKIYDPAMCCSTGVCGPDVDTELVQLASFLKNLDPCAVQVERFNLSQEPGVYTTGIVGDQLKEKGTDALPLILINDEIISAGAYPELKELARLLGVIQVTTDNSSGCCGGSNCC